MNTTELYNIRLDTGTTRDSTIMEKRGGGGWGGPMDPSNERVLQKNLFVLTILQKDDGY